MCVVWLSLMTLLLIIFVNFKLADELTKFRSKVKKINPLYLLNVSDDNIEMK